MARDWRWLAIAVLTAAALAMVCAATVEAQQAPAKSGAKKAKGGEQAEQDQDAAVKAPAKKKQDPVEAQRAIEAALKLLEAGKAEPAAQALSAVLAGGNLPPAIMAKALHYRGIAYRQQKKPAQAVADLTSALWLKGGLGEKDRADALRQRSAAYQEAGLSETGEAIAATVPTTSSTAAAPRASTRTTSTTQTWGTSTTPAPSAGLAADDGQAQPKASSGWSGFSNPFAGLFGGAASPEASQPVSQPTSTASIDKPAAAPEERRPGSSGWSRNTQVRGDGPVPIVTGALAAKPEGKFRVQVGIVRTESEAQALAAKARPLAQRDPEIDQTVVGNMGSFYRVRVGPFATQQDGQATCSKLKGSGLDCMVVAQ